VLVGEIYLLISYEVKRLVYMGNREEITRLQEKKRKNVRKKSKGHIIPYDRVFPSDPHGDKEDTRPVEIRRKGKPNVRILWSDIKDAL